MPRFDFAQHLSHLAGFLRSRYHLAAAYQHPGGKGEIREAVLADWLREFLPDTVLVSKGEIADAEGQRSREFDVILHLPSSAPKLFSSQEKRVVLAETVLGVIEVKSMLQPSHLKSFAEALSELNGLVRHFRPTELNKAVATATASEPFEETPVQLGDARQGVGPVHGGIFAFEGPSADIVKTSLDPVFGLRNFVWVFVLDRYFLMHERDGWRLSPWTRHHSMLLLVQALAGMCQDCQRFTHIEPNFDRYMDFAAAAVPGPGPQSG